MSTMADRVTGYAVTRRAAVTALGFASAALLAACAAPSPTPTSVPPKPTAAPTPAPTLAAQPTATLAAKAPPAPSAPAKATQPPAKAQVAKVVIAQPGIVLSFAPIYVARSRKFFEDEALDADVQVMQGDPQANAALVSGESQFMISGSNQLFVGHDKALGILAVAGLMTAVNLEFAVRNEYVRQKGVAPGQPLKDKMQALKGAKIAVGSLTGTGAQYGKYALKMNGVDPEADVDFIGVPQGAPRIAALREGQVDAFLGSIPDPEIIEFEGVGSVLIKLAEEMPILRSIVFNALYGKKDWVEQNPSVTERVCRAVGRANNLILNDLSVAKDVIKAAFPQINPQVLDVSMERQKTAFGPDARTTEQMWRNAGEVFLFAGTTNALPPLAEGTLWTNKYLVNVPKQ